MAIKRRDSSFNNINEKIELYKLIINEGADVTYDNNLPLRQSIDYYSPLPTELIIEKGADINTICK